MNSKSQDWIWTLFSISPFNLEIQEDVRRFIEETLPGNDPQLRYAIGQVERCPESGRLHLQLFVQYRRAVGLRRLLWQNGLPPSAGHAERRRGTASEAIEYCSKAATRVVGPFSSGQPAPGQGAAHNDGSYAANVSEFHVSSMERPSVAERVYPTTCNCRECAWFASMILFDD